MAMRSTQLDGIANAQPERVSNRVGRPCRGRDRVLRVSSVVFDLSSPRGSEQRGPRSETCHASEWLCLELLSIILGQVEERFTSSLVAVLMRRSGVIYATICMYKHTHTYIYGFLVCRYARSLGLAACQNTPALDAAFYYPISTLYQLQPSFHTESTEPEPTARARRAGKEFY